ncbi:MAG: PhoH family protein [Acidobacteriota bacterium]
MAADATGTVGAETTRHLSLAEEGLESLFGSHDQNLKRLEKAFKVRIAARGTDVSIEGLSAAVDTVSTLLEQLSSLVESGFRIRQEDMRTAVRVVRQAPDMSLVEFFQPQDPTMMALQRTVSPRSVNQYLYLRAMLEHDIVVSTGPAGTGKTFMAVAMAAAALQDKRVRRIVLARPAVEAGEKLGFLPGDLAEKVNPYLRPLYDSLYDILGVDRVGRLLERQIIEVAPIAFMRGRTLNDSFVILDEAQNTTPEQMKMFLTRIGFNSKAVINGDVTQVDLPSSKHSGLRQALEILRGVRGIGFVHFDRSDVVRHPLVQKIVAAYEQFERVQDRAADAAESGSTPAA